MTTSPPSRPNILIVMTDTFRTSHVGCYGSTKVHTPHIDAFAAGAMRFTRAYPESLPTIPVRRAIHTGRRAYPFRNYKPVKWDIVYLPGWQAMDNDEDTLAENLAAAGYHTGFVTDTLPYFAPGFNFQRGFWQWEYIRGQQQDRWRSPFSVPPERLARYVSLPELPKGIHSLVPYHLANTSHVRDESDTSTARTFRWAMDFLEDNTAGQPFYLLVDCFDPHEPWEAPENYYRMYGDPSYPERRIVHCGYGPAQRFGYTPGEIAYVEAQYCGLCSLVDTWFGKLLIRLDQLGLSNNTAVFFISDHGTNFCDNPRNVIGKPDDAMYPGVVHLPFIARLPGRSDGAACSELVYNTDLVATVYELAGVASRQGIDGRSLMPLLAGRGSWTRREYVTSRYNHSLVYINDRTHLLTNVDARPQEAFDLECDLACRNPLPEAETKARLKLAWQRLMDDAAGEMPDYRVMKQTDAIGQKRGKWEK